MKNLNRIFSLFLAVISMTSCYEDFVKDYEHTATYFAAQKPLRTVISDRDMTISVGVVISGIREVDPDDWARFAIDATLLEGTGLTMLPQEYYTLSDPEMFRISDKTLPIADVTISFTDAFYQDAHSTGLHYALPFRIVETSSDMILEGMETSIVAIKYISSWQGTYYVRGSISELDAGGNVVSTKNYWHPDLTQNITRTVSTVSSKELMRAGFANYVTDDADDRFRIIVNDDKTLTLLSDESANPISDGEGTLDDSKERLELKLKYKFEKDGRKYSVDEILVRRRDPYADLRFETWGE